jgi:phospholipid/cholesterol/gamma-HCH transport system permease protein
VFLNPVSMIERTGNGFINWILGIFSMLRLSAACIAWCLTGWLYGQPVRFSAITMQIVELGVKSLPLTALFAFSFGSVVGLQVDLLLDSVDYLPPILTFVGNFFIKQQAPVIVGILLAARVGGAFTSELSSMVIDGEVAALKTMGIDPVRFIVAPAFVAMLIVTPLLTMLMVAGQLITLALYLFFTKGVAAIFVVSLAVEGIEAPDMATGILKGLLYGVVILGISAQTALTAVESGRSTGSATTFAVVVSITAVLVADAVISILILG